MCQGPGVGAQLLWGLRKVREGGGQAGEVLGEAGEGGRDWGLWRRLWPYPRGNRQPGSVLSKRIRPGYVVQAPLEGGLVLIWLCWGLVAAHKVFIVGLIACYRWDLSYSMTRDQTCVPCLAGITARGILNLWISRVVPRPAPATSPFNFQPYPSSCKLFHEVLLALIILSTWNL